MNNWLCENCVYWVRKPNFGESNTRAVGECRFNPPTIGVKVSSITKVPERFPITDSHNDYCGRFESKEWGEL